MKIVYVITGLGMGGAEKQVCLLADKMVERGNHIVLVSLSDNAKVLPENKAVIVHQLGMSKHPLSFFKSYLRLRSLIKKIEPDVVHSHLFHANIMCRMLRCSTKIDYLISSSHSRHEGGWLRRNLYKRTAVFADLVTNVSDDAIKENIRCHLAPKSKIIKVNNGIDTNKIYFSSDARKTILDEFGLSPEHKILLSVGRFTAAKDYPTLLHAFKKLIENDNALRLIVVGDGELFSQMSELKSQLLLDDYVIFTGIRQDIASLMSAADIYVMSSAWEGLPLVIGEAMACHCLIVTTRCGGVEEILGSCGKIVPVRNPQLLADGILKTLNSTITIRDELRKNARERVENNFSINVVVNNWLDIYSKNHEK